MRYFRRTHALVCVWSSGVVRTVFFNVVPQHDPTHTVLWSYGLDGRVRCTYNDNYSWSVYGERRRAGSLLLLLFVIVVMPSIWQSPHGGAVDENARFTADKRENYTITRFRSNCHYCCCKRQVHPRDVAHCIHRRNMLHVRAYCRRGMFYFLFLEGPDGLARVHDILLSLLSYKRHMCLSRLRV